MRTTGFKSVSRADRKSAAALATEITTIILVCNSFTIHYIVYDMTTPFRGTIPLPVLRLLRKLGTDIRDARLRRRIRAATVAERALISPTTLHRIERGDPGVSMGNYATVLFALGLHDGISSLADRSRDVLGLDLLEERLPQRVRVPRRGRGPGAPRTE